MRRIYALAAVALVATGTFAQAETRVEAVARHLTEQGYTEIEISRTFLGRARIEAHKGDMEREIVMNPNTGEILRDYWEGEDDAHHVLGRAKPDEADGHDDNEVGDSDN